VRCETVVDRLAGAVDDPSLLDAEEARHVAGCVRCRTDLAAYRRLGAEMGAMRTEQVPVSAAEATDVLARLDTALDRRLRQRRAACLGGLARPSVVGLGGVAMLASRRRTA